MGVQRYVLRSGAVRYRARVKFLGREVATRVFERRADATAWEQEQRRRLRLGEWTDPRRGRVPLSDVAADWLNSRGLVKRRTRESDEAAWRNYVRPYPGRAARAHGCLRGPAPRCRAGPGAGRAALGRTGWSPGRRPGICAWPWPASEPRGAGERGRRRAVCGHAEEPPGPDGAAGGRAGADHRSVDHGEGSGGLAVRCARRRAAAGVELEALSRMAGRQGGSRCAGCARSRSAPHGGITVAGRWRGPEGGAAGAGARHRRDDDGPLWAPGGCQLVANRPADRGTTGASEPLEGRIRTESGPGLDAKNP
jgi:hypothetical protein